MGFDMGFDTGLDTGFGTATEQTTPTVTPDPGAPATQPTPRVTPVPLSITLVSPQAGKATHLFRSLAIGNPGAQGGVLLIRRFDVGIGADFTNVPLVFDPGSLILSINLAIVTPFLPAGTHALNFGNAPGGSQFLAADDLTVAAGIHQNLVTGFLTAANTMYVSSTGLATATAGQATVVVFYAGTPIAPWS